MSYSPAEDILRVLAGVMGYDCWDALTPDQQAELTNITFVKSPLDNPTNLLFDQLEKIDDLHECKLDVRIESPLFAETDGQYGSSSWTCDLCSALVYELIKNG